MLASLPPPSVLTPLVVERMKDTLPPKFRHRLLRILDRMMKECYVPLSGANLVAWEDSYRKGLERFAPVRLDLLRALMELESESGDVLERVREALLGVETEWLRGRDRLGLGRTLMRRFFRGFQSHWKFVDGVLRACQADPSARAVLENGTHPEYLQALLEHGTVADYCATGVLLGMEGEIHLEPGPAALLAERGMNAMQRLDTHLSLLTSSESARDAACRSAMAQWKLVPEAGGRVPKACFEEEPVSLHGESLSDLIVRERR